MTISNNTTGYRPGVCTSSSRPSAPYEGQMIYETDTNRVLVWDNAAWVMIVSADSPPGLQLIKTQTSSAVSNFNVTDVFSAQFTNYVIKTNLTQSGGSAALRMQFMVGTTPTAASYLGKSLYYDTNGTTVGFTTQENRTTDMPVGHIGTSSASGHQGTINVFRPFTTTPQYKAITGDAMGLLDGAYFTGAIFASSFSNPLAHDGFRFFCSNGSTITGTVRVYGLRD